MKVFALVALPLLLSGCWVGEDFYALSEAKQVIEPGKYRVHGEYSVLADTNDRPSSDEIYGRNDVRISYAPNGQTIVESRSDGDKQMATVVEFDREQGTYIAQMGLEAEALKSVKGGASLGSALFALIRLTPRGYDLAVPICNDYKRVSSHPRIYAKSSVFGLHSCTFGTRAELEEAMAKYAEEPIRWTSYWRKKKQ